MHAYRSEALLEGIQRSLFCLPAMTKHNRCGIEMDASAWKMSARRLWFPLVLAGAIAVTYGSALSHGLTWDDPIFYASAHSSGGVAQAFTSPQPPTNQYYRPLAVLYGALFTTTGTVSGPMVHGFQIGFHLVTALILTQVLSSFGFGTVHARLAALGFAVSPLTYYAVAGQQNQQVPMLMCMLLAVRAGQLYTQGRAWPWLGLSLLTYAMALGFQEGAAPFVIVFLWLAAKTPGQTPVRRWLFPLSYLGIVAIYALVWFTMPLNRSVTGQGLQPEVLAFLLQGAVFPASAALAPWLREWSSSALIPLFFAIWLGLSAILWRHGARGPLAVCWMWAGAALLPLWAGLSWEYAQTSPRILYPSLPAVFGVWAGVAAFSFTARGVWRIIGGLVLVLVVWVSTTQVVEARRIFAVTTDHLNRTISLLSSYPQQRFAFINFPDRVELRPAPYSLGFWGIILAPVIQDLSDYARIETGARKEDRSFSSPMTGHGDRKAWPYRVDMRGVNSGAEELFSAARWSDGVFLSDYLPDGTLRLREIGQVREATAEPAIATFGHSAQFISGRALVTDRAQISLVWRCLDRLQPEDALLVHLWKDGEFIDDVGGDAVGGMIPLSACEPGTEIVDVREESLSRLPPGRYQVYVGIYNRTDGNRYEAHAEPGATAADGVVPAAQFVVD